MLLPDLAIFSHTTPKLFTFPIPQHDICVLQPVFLAPEMADCILKNIPVLCIFFDTESSFAVYEFVVCQVGLSGFEVAIFLPMAELEVVVIPDVFRGREVSGVYDHFWVGTWREEFRYSVDAVLMGSNGDEILKAPPQRDVGHYDGFFNRELELRSSV